MHQTHSRTARRLELNQWQIHRTLSVALKTTTCTAATGTTATYRLEYVLEHEAVLIEIDFVISHS